MEFKIRSLRSFIGSVDFEVSRSFYKELGFEETVLSEGFSVFQRDGLSFYLQNYNVKEWLENSMLFIEVTDVAACYEWLQELRLDQKYPGVRLMPIKKEGWGEECFLIDPAGVLLHFGQFYPNS